ncbi:hypothetical protein BC008_36505 [Mastigocoleus testarum BC008]|uniref:N-acetyltransferase domain-containing protein n=1 Tax=Mastigocoleus testarum BC008 TaxID=371196 RepID=A0A0V7ZR46_9CYAN|nr:hypothetical protein BC008_26900 [Mastigocoleus testarum BC008]KST70160.1 hypothetical protein BC008_36505 [Mastigocoleus testarum BC008]
MVIEKSFVSEEILTLTSEHLDACANLLVQVFNKEPWNESWSFDSARTLLWEIFHTPGFVGFVFCDRKKLLQVDSKMLQAGQELLGFIAGYSEQSCNYRRFFLREICVRSDRQRQGIGKKLLRHLVETLSTMDINLIYLLTMKDGELKKFYTKNGFLDSPHMMLMLQQI